MFHISIDFEYERVSYLVLVFTSIDKMKKELVIVFCSIKFKYHDKIYMNFLNSGKLKSIFYKNKHKYLGGGKNLHELPPASALFQWDDF